MFYKNDCPVKSWMLLSSRSDNVVEKLILKLFQKQVLLWTRIYLFEVNNTDENPKPKLTHARLPFFCSIYYSSASFRSRCCWNHIPFFSDIIKDTLMEIWKFCYMLGFIGKQYPENFVFLILSRVVFNIFDCFFMFVNKNFIYLACAYLKK